MPRTCHGKEQGRKGRGKEVQSGGCQVAQPKRVRLGHFVFRKKSTSSLGVLALVCQDVTMSGGGLWNDYGACELGYQRCC